MGIINFLFSLLRRHTPSESMDANEFSDLYKEAMQWDMGISQKSEKGWERFYAKYSRLWYIKVLLMILYIPVNIYLTKVSDPNYILRRNARDMREYDDDYGYDRHQ